MILIKLLSHRARYKSTKTKLRSSRWISSEKTLKLEEISVRIAQLFQRLKQILTFKSSFKVPSNDAAQTEEIEKLRKQLEETAAKLLTTQDFKKSLEVEIESLNEKVNEMKNDLDLKSSGAKASEECMRDEMRYLEKRVNDLEIELGDRTKTIEQQQVELSTIEELKKQLLADNEQQQKQRLDSEKSLTDQISSKDSDIEKLRKEIETMLSSDSGIKEAIKEKDSEILRFSEKESMLNERLQQLEKSLKEKSEAFIAQELELKSLQNVFQTVEAEFQSLQKSSEKQSEELIEKTVAQQQLQKNIEDQTNEISVLRLEVERFQSSLKNTGDSIQKSHEIEENLKKQIAELLESKVKLESDIAIKETGLKDAESQQSGLKKEIVERDCCIAGLEAEVKGIKDSVAEKESAIAQSIKDFNELKERNQKNLESFESAKQALNDELTAFKKSNEEVFNKLKSEAEVEKDLLKSKTDELAKNLKDKDSQLEKTEKNVTLLSELKTSLDEKLLSRENELKELTTKLNKVEREDAEKVSLCNHFSSFPVVETFTFH